MLGRQFTDSSFECCGDVEKILGKAIEHASPLGHVVELLSEVEGNAVEDDKLDLAWGILNPSMD